MQGALPARDQARQSAMGAKRQEEKGGGGTEDPRGTGSCGEMNRSREPLAQKRPMISCHESRLEGSHPAWG